MDTQRQGSLGTISESAYHTLFLGKPDRQNFPVPQSWPSDWVLANRTRTEWCLPFSESFLLPPAYGHSDLGNSMLKMAKPKKWKKHKILNQKLNKRRRHSWIRNLWTWNQQVTFYHLGAIISLGITAAGLIFSNIPVRLRSRKCQKDEGPAVCEKAERERDRVIHMVEGSEPSSMINTYSPHTSFFQLFRIKSIPSPPPKKVKCLMCIYFLQKILTGSASQPTQSKPGGKKHADKSRTLKTKSSKAVTERMKTPDSATGHRVKFGSFSTKSPRGNIVLNDIWADVAKLQ